MELDHHRRILGKYIHEKCALTLWTRYTPPRWEPGMLPGDAGEVKRRYLSVEDRTVPNAIGIYYRLFEHPALALPVVYHEFLHFGGVGGDMGDAIECEAEVWMREIMFMQFLIARIAPENENEIPAYEKRIADLVERLKLRGIGIQTQYDLSDPAFLPSFCDMIERIYGRPKSEEDALLEVEEQIERANMDIEKQNRHSETKRNWHPEIAWPPLGSEQTAGLTEKYRSILTKSKTVCHRMDAERYTEVVEEPESRVYLAEWEKYKNRQSSMKVFDERWGSFNRISPETVAAVVDRFGVTETQALEALNHIFQNLIETADSNEESKTATSD
jgi:hypothetical protein